VCVQVCKIGVWEVCGVRSELAQQGMSMPVFTNAMGERQVACVLREAHYACGHIKHAVCPCAARAVCSVAVCKKRSACQEEEG